MTLRSSLLALSLTGLALTFAPGCAAPTADETTADSEVVKKGDAQIEAEITAAAQGLVYISESDHPYTFVKADKAAGDTKTISQTLIRTRFASYVDQDPDADKPMASLFAMTGSWPEWWKTRDHECDYESDRDGCVQERRLYDAINKNLRDVEIHYFGANGRRGMVEGTGVSIFIVGRTPSGNYAGIRTIAIWT